MEPRRFSTALAEAKELDLYLGFLGTVPCGGSVTLLVPSNTVLVEVGYIFCSNSPECDLLRAAGAHIDVIMEAK